jgi:hypothetical protein
MVAPFLSPTASMVRLMFEEPAAMPFTVMVAIMVLVVRNPVLANPAMVTIPTPLSGTPATMLQPPTEAAVKASTLTTVLFQVRVKVNAPTPLPAPRFGMLLIVIGTLACEAPTAIEIVAPLLTATVAPSAARVFVDIRQVISRRTESIMTVNLAGLIADSFLPPSFYL